MANTSRNDKPKAAPKSVSSLSPKKQRHARSWTTGQERKRLRREAQEAAATRNRALRARGELTPWEQAKSAAKHRKGQAAPLSEGDKARLADARARGVVPVVRLEGNGSNISSKATAREAIRAAKRGGSAE